MSKLNCPVLKSKAAIQASKNACTAGASLPTKGMQFRKQILVTAALGLAFGLGATLSFQFSAIASLAHKETELVSIHAVADAIHAEKASLAAEVSADVAAIERTKNESVAAL
jgi:hypothetical protein